MFSCTRISAVEYYIAVDAQAAADGQRPDAASAGRNAVAYYCDNGAGESSGVWWTPAIGSRAASSPFMLARDGESVDTRVLRDLAAGRNPVTKEPLVQQTTERRSVGYDIQISAPKSVSVLAAFADHATRRIIFEAHDRAFRRALDFAFQEGLIVTRRGKGGRQQEPVAECTAAIFRHFTSRAGDPQLHSHGILTNCCVRQSEIVANHTTTGTIENYNVLRYGGAIAALYRSELVSALKHKLGVECVRSGRNVEVAIFPKAVLDRFSKRRKMIERAAAEHGFDTSANREAAQIASYQTRSAKHDLPPLAELETRWSVELGSEGWNAEQLWHAVSVEAEHIRRQRQQKIDHSTSRISVCAAVVDRLVADQTVFERRMLLRYAAEALQAECTADEILAEVEDLERRGTIVRVGVDNNEPVYSTRAMIGIERDMLRTALARRNEREFVSSETVERIIAQRPGLREEQRVAVRHALNRDGMSIILGSAGVGKSFSMSAIAAVARDPAAGLEFWTIAPSWKAVDVIRTATGTAEEMARAVHGFIIRVQRGEIKLLPSSLVCLDEGSMVGLESLATLTHLCAAASAKLVVCSDIGQLQPVNAAGLPVAALARVLGSSQMNEIQRQKDPNHRAASMDFATGDPVRALESYDRAGAILWGQNREETIARLAEDYIHDRNRSDLNQKEHRGTKRSRAVLATWNADVQDLNQCIRARLRQAGGLTGEDFSITAVPRGGGRPGTLALAAGDEVIFGESVKVGSHNIRNADIGEVQRIGGDPADPSITIRFASGVEVTARVSELVGYRRKDEPHYPRIQHAYALTVHAAQGITVNDCYVANLRGLSREASYVSMTRHCDRVRLYIDLSRTRDALAARAPARVMTTRSSIELPEEDDSRGEPSEVSIRTAIMEESRRSDRKVNVSDFIDDIEAWVNNAEPGCGAGAGSAPPYRGKAAAVREALSSQPLVQLSPAASRPAQHSSTGAGRIARRMHARAESPARYAPSRSAIGSRRSTGNTMREEMNRLLSTAPLGSSLRHSDGQYCDIWNTEIRVATELRRQTAISRIAGRIKEIHIRVREWWRQKFGTWAQTGASHGPAEGRLTPDSASERGAVAMLVRLPRRHRNAVWRIDHADDRGEGLRGYAVRHAIVTENPDAKTEAGGGRRLQEQGLGGPADAVSSANATAEYDEYRPTPRRNRRPGMAYRGPRL